jgi:hypothetical protein
MLYQVECGIASGLEIICDNAQTAATEQRPIKRYNRDSTVPDTSRKFLIIRIGRNDEQPIWSMSHQHIQAAYFGTTQIHGDSNN